MTVALWIVNIALAVCFIGAGGMKSVRSKTALQQAGMGWTEGFKDSSVKWIGIAEVVGAIGLIVPLLFPLPLDLLAPIAALCLAVLMLGAVITHQRRREKALPAQVLLVVSIISAILGFIVVFARA
ncbi:MAG: DoxX family protein [Microbacterium sp.]